jgi:hypothetical protein
VIVTNSRQVRGERLFLVDRTKQRISFWSNRLDDVLEFNHKTTAEAAMKKLKFNCPRIVTYEEAQVFANTQNSLREAANREFYQAHLEPWDDHKGWR